MNIFYNYYAINKLKVGSIDKSLMRTPTLICIVVYKPHYHTDLSYTQHSLNFNYVISTTSGCKLWS